MAAESERRRNRPESSASFYDYLFFFYFFFFKFSLSVRGHEEKEDGPAPLHPLEWTSSAAALDDDQTFGPMWQNKSRQTPHFPPFLHIFFFGINYANEEEE